MKIKITTQTRTDEQNTEAELKTLIDSFKPSPFTALAAFCLCFAVDAFALFQLAL